MTSARNIALARSLQIYVLLCLVGCVAPSPLSKSLSQETIACQVRHDEDVESDVAVPPVSIYVMNGDGSERTEVGEGRRPAWSPDGRKLAVIDRYFQSLEIIDLQSGERTSVLQTDPYLDSVAWSPDGRRIAVARDYRSIWLVDADGSSLRHLTDFAPRANPTGPSWSPTGTRIAFADFPEGEEELSDIYAIDVESSATTRLTDSEGVYSDPKWSPTGDRIAFDRYSDGEYFVMVMNSDGSEPRAIGPGILYGWSPDGLGIYFHFFSEDTLWTMNTDGSHRTQLFELDCEFPAWSPVVEVQDAVE